MQDKNLPAKRFDEIAVKINQQVENVIKSSAHGFEMAFVKATAIEEIKKLLTDEYMEPIMALQGTKIGFKTDKDKTNGYPKDIVKSCLIEAVLTGLEPTGNQFNIIAGNMYTTKEGFGHLLGTKIEGLWYKIVPGLPRINQARDGAAIEMSLEWRFNNGELLKEKLDIPVKFDQYSSTDSVIGKATRKARAWLYATITGTEIPEGDASENDAAKTIPIVGTTVNKERDVEAERMIKLIEAATTIEELEGYKKHLKTQEEKDAYQRRGNQLIDGRLV